MKKLSLFICMLLIPALIFADGNSEIDLLKKEVELLKAENAKNQKLITELTSRLDALEESDRTEPETATPVLPIATSSADRTYQSMNPDISVIGTFAGNYDNNAATRKWDWKMSGVEFGFQMIADPYIRADIFTAFHEHVHQDGDEVHSEVKAILEEAYLTTLGLPAGLQLKAGKFRTPFGKIGDSHLHALPYADYPLVYANMLGHHGLTDDAFALSWITPLPWYSEVTAVLGRGPAENGSFARSHHDDFVYMGRWKNYFDLSDSTTFEVGLTAVQGPNSEDNYTKTLLRSGYISLKWKPLKYNTYYGLTWLSEYIHRKAENNFTDDTKEWGYYSLLDARFAKRWYVGGRFDYYNYSPDYSGSTATNPETEKAYSAFLAWHPSEFQSMKLQYKYSDYDYMFPALQDDNNHELFMQWIWVIGAHGAHKY